MQSMLAMQSKALTTWTIEHNEWAVACLNVVIVNGRNFLLKKKGFEFMPLEHRMLMVDYCMAQRNTVVVSWDQVGDDPTVAKALEIIEEAIAAAEKTLM